MKSHLKQGFFEGLASGLASTTVFILAFYFISRYVPIKVTYDPGLITITWTSK